MLEQAEIRGPVSRDIVLQIHGLYAEIEPLGRRIGGFGTDGVLLAKQARVAVDQERGTEPELIRTTSPITIRSNGFSSTRSGTIISCSKGARERDRPRRLENVVRTDVRQASRHPVFRDLESRVAAGFSPQPGSLPSKPCSAQQLQHALVRMVGQRPRGPPNRLPG